MSATGNSESLLKRLRTKAGRLYSFTLNSCNAVRGAFYMRRCAADRKKAGLRNPIRVGFLAQTPEVWDKQMSLFEYMQKDPRFEPRLIYVPHMDYVRYVRNEASEVNPEEKAFYEKLYADLAIARETVTDDESLTSRRNVRTHVVEAGSAVEGKLILEVPWPEGTHIINISRGGMDIVPTGHTRLYALDEILVSMGIENESITEKRVRELVKSRIGLKQ